MEAVGRALVGLSVYLQLKKAAMHEYHLWNLKKIKQLIFYMFVLYRPTQKKVPDSRNFSFQSDYTINFADLFHNFSFYLVLMFTKKKKKVLLPTLDKIKYPHKLW